MKIVIVNYRYFISGGPERYLFNITDTLERNGHTVVPFSIAHNKNRPSPYSAWFMKPLGSGNEVFANEYKRSSPRTVITALSRMLYSFEAKRKLKALIRAEKPDVVYVLYYQNKMSCSVIDAAWEMKVPVVVRISDFGQICPNNVFYIYQQNTVCERCLHGTRLNAVKYKCVGGSYMQSFMKALALKIQDIRRTRKKTAAYVIPAAFTAEKFLEYGVPGEKINVIPTFFNASNKEDVPVSYGDFFLYVGRIDPDKGILTMVKAFVGSPYKLVIIGSSIKGYDQEIRDFLKDKPHHISFLGHLDFSEIRVYLETCLCTVSPSECYDNMPNAVLESYAHKKAVIASGIGAMIDLVPDKGTGLQFRVADPEDLRSKLAYMHTHPEAAKEMGSRGYDMLHTDFAEQLHYERLINLFKKVTSGNH